MDGLKLVPFIVHKLLDRLLERDGTLPGSSTPAVVLWTHLQSRIVFFPKNRHASGGRGAQLVVWRSPMSVTRHGMRALCAAFLLSLVSALSSAPCAGQQASIPLPTPQTTGGMPLMQALAKRKTDRAFADKQLSPQALSNLLWAGFGVNRSRSVKPGLGRTAPSASNSQDVEIYVLLPQGIYVYDAEHNLLRQHLAGDLRTQILPDEAVHAAVSIVFVAPLVDPPAEVDSGFIGQNLYLFAASEGLNSWFYGLHKPGAAAALQLPAGRRALSAQTIGFPPEK